MTTYNKENRWEIEGKIKKRQSMVPYYCRSNLGMQVGNTTYKTLMAFVVIHLTKLKNLGHKELPKLHVLSDLQSWLVSQQIPLTNSKISDTPVDL
jgi:hypothetical protein